MSDDSRQRRDRVRRDPLARLERMMEIRAAEDVIMELFREGLIPGSTHTAQGQEAVAVGLAAALRPDDQVVCTYRGHGHALALGMPLEALFGEMLGRATGCVGGLGGSMHLYDGPVGLLPTMAIVGAGLPIAVGVGLTAITFKSDVVSVAVFGDGASNIGAFHESLNLAAVWRLPVIFVCENNLYGEYSPLATTTPVRDIATRASSYGIPGEVVDGQDLTAVRVAVDSAVSRARSGGGPSLLEMKTYRYAGHSRSDPAEYRPSGELEKWLARDPIDLYARHLLDSGETDASRVNALRERVARSVESAVRAARDAPPPNVRDMFDHVFATGIRSMAGP